MGAMTRSMPIPPAEQLKAIGQRLQDARLAQNLSVESMTRELRANRIQIAGIEAGDMRSFYNPLFYLDLVERYARMLHFSESAISKMLALPNEPAVETPTVPPSVGAPQQDLSVQGAPAPEPNPPASSPEVATPEVATPGVAPPVEPAVMAASQAAHLQVSTPVSIPAGIPASFPQASSLQTGRQRALVGRLAVGVGVVAVGLGITIAITVSPTRSPPTPTQAPAPAPVAAPADPAPQAGSEPTASGQAASGPTTASASPVSTTPTPPTSSTPSTPPKPAETAPKPSPAAASPSTDSEKKSPVDTPMTLTAKKRSWLWVRDATDTVRQFGVAEGETVRFDQLPIFIVVHDPTVFEVVIGNKTVNLVRNETERNVARHTRTDLLNFSQR